MCWSELTATECWLCKGVRAVPASLPARWLAPARSTSRPPMYGKLNGTPLAKSGCTLSAPCGACKGNGRALCSGPGSGCSRWASHHRRRAWPPERLLRALWRSLGSRLPEHVRCVVGVRCRHSHANLRTQGAGVCVGSGFRWQGPNRSSGVQLADIVHGQDEAAAADLTHDKLTSCPRRGRPSKCSADSSSCVTGSTDRILAVYLTSAIHPLPSKTAPSSESRRVSGCGSTSAPESRAQEARKRR